MQYEYRVWSVSMVGRGERLHRRPAEEDEEGGVRWLHSTFQ